MTIRRILVVQRYLPLPGQRIPDCSVQSWVFGSPFAVRSPSDHSANGRRHWGRGDVSPGSEFYGGRSPKIAVFKIKISQYLSFFRLSNISKIKWAKSEEKSDFGGRSFFDSQSESVPRSQKFVATPLTRRLSCHEFFFFVNKLCTWTLQIQRARAYPECSIAWDPASEPTTVNVRPQSLTDQARNQNDINISRELR